MLLVSLVRVQNSERVAVTVHSLGSCTAQTTSFFPADVRSSSGIRTAIVASSGSVIMELRAADEDLVSNEGEEQRVYLSPFDIVFLSLPHLVFENEMKSIFLN